MSKAKILSYKHCRSCGKKLLHTDVAIKYDRFTGKPTRRRKACGCPSYGGFAGDAHDYWNWEYRVEE